MANAELSRRVEEVVGYPPLSELGDLQRREFHEALLEAASFEDLYRVPVLAENDRGYGCDHMVGRLLRLIALKRLWDWFRARRRA